MSDNPDRQRLDVLLVALGHSQSRARARDAITRGSVAVNGATVTKPGTLVSTTANIVYDDPAGGYVSRAALKLIAGLDSFGFDPSGRLALDIGASTGGFTEVLLERGASQVLAFDVGHGQLHERIAKDPCVTARDGFNARDLTAGDLPAAPQAIVCDVSFISIKLALPPALTLAAPGAWGTFLIKPQFEVGRDRLGKGGIVRDPAIARETADDISAWLDTRDNWRVSGFIQSPITGGDGNTEFLIGAVKDGD